MLEITTKTISQLTESKSYNKSTLFDENDRIAIGRKVAEIYKRDHDSLEDDRNKWQEIRDLLNNKKLGGRRGAEIFYPLLQTAIQNFVAEAYPVVFQDGHLVKAQVIGKDEGTPLIDPIDKKQVIDDEKGKPVESIPTGLKAMKGQRRASYDNYVIMNKIDDYEKGTDKLLISLATYGTFFTKVTYNSNLKKIHRDIVYTQNLIANSEARDDIYTTLTQVYALSYNEIVSRQKSGVFDKNVELETLSSTSSSSESKTGQENVEGENADSTHIFLEQHTWLDLDGDGYAEPYIAIVHKESGQLFGLYPRYTDDDITKEGSKIIDIKPKEYFVKWDCIPNYDEKFYSQGLGHLLFHINNSVNTINSQLVDSGSLANKSTGFISKALKQRAGNVELGIGEWKFIDMFGVDLRQAILPIDHKEPSIVLFQLMQFLLEGARGYGGLQASIGEDLGSNTAPTTAMAIVQQGSKQFKAIYKRIYRSLKKEIQLIDGIIKEDIDGVFSADYETVLDDKLADFTGDYDDKNADIIPISGASIITNLEKLQRVQFELSLAENPVFNPFIDVQKVLQNAISVYDPDAINLIQTPSPQQPDFNTQLLINQQKIDEMKAQTSAGDLQRKIAEGAVKAKEADMKGDKIEAEIEKMKADTMKVLSEIPLMVREAIRKEAELLYQQQENQNEPTGRQNQTPTGGTQTVA